MYLRVLCAIKCKNRPITQNSIAICTTSLCNVAHGLLQLHIHLGYNRSVFISVLFILSQMWEPPYTNTKNRNCQRRFVIICKKLTITFNNNLYQAVREAATICPRPYKLTFDLLTLKVVSESRVTWPTSVPILVFLGLSVLDLGPIYATNRRLTSDRQMSDAHHRLMPPTLWAGHNNRIYIAPYGRKFRGAGFASARHCAYQFMELKLQASTYNHMCDEWQNGGGAAESRQNRQAGELRSIYHLLLRHRRLHHARCGEQSDAGN